MHAYGPTNRNVPNLLRNLRLAWQRAAGRAAVARSSRRAPASPSRSPGSGRLLGIPTIYVESVTRIEGLSLSGRLIKPGRHSSSTRSGPSSPSPPRAASASPATSSRPDDPRHRRHQRAAVRPPDRAPPPRSPGDEALLVQYGSSHAARTAAASGSTSCSFDDLAAGSPSRRARSSATPASARSCSRAATATARSSCRAGTTSARRSTITSSRSRERLAAAGMVTLVEDEAELPAALSQPHAVPGGANGVLQGPGALTADVRALLIGLGAPRVSARAA